MLWIRLSSTVCYSFTILLCTLLASCCFTMLYGPYQSYGWSAFSPPYELCAPWPLCWAKLLLKLGF